MFSRAQTAARPAAQVVRACSWSQSETTSGSLDHVRAEPGPGVYDVSVEVRDYEKFEFKAVRLAGVREIVLDAYFREKAR